MAVGLVTAAVRRSAWCGTRSQRRKYLKHVPGQLLKVWAGGRVYRSGWGGWCGGVCVWGGVVDVGGCGVQMGENEWEKMNAYV